MTIYKKSESFPFKWVLAIFIFIMILTITWSEVGGLNVPTSTGFRSVIPDSNSNNTLYTHSTHSMSTDVMSYPDECYSPDDGDDSDEPSETPEASTLILLTCGLGALFIALRLR